MSDDNSHPWTGSREEFCSDVLPTLHEHGHRIGDASRAGCPLAQEIVERYAMLHRSFDPMTAILVKESLAKWLKENVK